MEDRRRLLGRFHRAGAYFNEVPSTLVNYGHSKPILLLFIVA
jgi:hypothetical protein